jgi:Fur family peroxide stress response transcriptional regulator
MQKLDLIVKDLRKDGYRITPQRVAIIDYILSTESHPTAESMHEVIQKKHPMVSLATVYKTLDLLKKKGIVQELRLAGGSRYDANVGRHVNLVCVNCGKIEDVDYDLLEEIENKVARKSKYDIVGSKFELYGYCSDCQKAGIAK